jgi:hypothetical protein
MVSVAIDRRARSAKSQDCQQKGVCDEAMVPSPGGGRRIRLRTDVNDGTDDQSCGLGPTLVPCRLVLGQLHEVVPTRTRTQCHGVRQRHRQAWIRQRGRLHRELIAERRPLRLAASQEFEWRILRMAGFRMLSRRGRTRRDGAV